MHCFDVCSVWSPQICFKFKQKYQQHSSCFQIIFSFLMFGLTKRSSFLLRNIYLYSLWYLAALKSLNARGGFILTLSFPDNKVIMKNCFFNCIPFLCPLSKEWFILRKSISIQNQFNVVSQPQRVILFSLVWSWFWHVPVSSILLWILLGCSIFHKQRPRIMTCEFTINKLHVDVITKERKC